MLHKAPLNPKAQVAGTPIATEIQLEAVTATKTDLGYSIARKAVDGPKNALPNSDVTATIGSK
jgi:hypothetical protein